MKTDAIIYVCPNCKKEISEYALECPNCGCSFDLQQPVKIAVDESKIHLVNKSLIIKLVMILSVIVGAVSLFVFVQAILAINVMKANIPANGLIIFRDVAVMKNFIEIKSPLITSGIIMVVCIVLIIICAIKLLNKRK